MGIGITITLIWTCNLQIKSMRLLMMTLTMQQMFWFGY